MEFLNVPGASGAQYRFRRAILNDLPATAGNLVAVSGTPPKHRFLLCAAAASLSRASPALRDALAQRKGAAVFIRLNVTRAVREAEHADIAAAVQPELALTDLD